MINQGNNVPDKTIAVFADNTNTDITSYRIKNIIEKPSTKRDWFTPHFYRCLPLTIGNRYGFIIKTEYAFSAVWDGGEGPEAITFKTKEHPSIIDTKIPQIKSHFGSGIITISPPFSLRTPPGVNLMTINPPNIVVPNITVMTGVVETDNLRKNFTFNLKMQIPKIEVMFEAGAEIAAFIPIPRYFADSFELKMAEEIFSKEVIDEEIKAAEDHGDFRKNIEPELKHGINRMYYQGKDVYGNEFLDHQKP